MASMNHIIACNERIDVAFSSCTYSNQKKKEQGKSGAKNAGIPQGLFLASYPVSKHIGGSGGYYLCELVRLHCFW